MIPQRSNRAITDRRHPRVIPALTLSAGVGIGLLAGAASAQGVAAREAAAYPTKPIRFVVASSVGGGNDVLARILGPRLSESFGKQIVVDNRSGAGGILGSDIVAKAPPDGYTMLIVAGGLRPQGGRHQAGMICQAEER